MEPIGSLYDLSEAKGIKLVSLNIRSLFKNLDEVQVILEEGTVDVLALPRNVNLLINGLTVIALVYPTIPPPKLQRCWFW